MEHLSLLFENSIIPSIIIQQFWVSAKKGIFVDIEGELKPPNYTVEGNTEFYLD